MNPIVDRIARALYENAPPIARAGWSDLPDRLKAGWRSDARIALAIAIEEASKLADARDPDKPAHWLLRRGEVAPAIRGMGNDLSGDEWKCPIERPGCYFNCGSYGCGN